MIDFTMFSGEKVTTKLAKRLKRRRLAQNLTLDGLSKRSGVPLGTLKKFERTGKIALVSFVRLALALRDEEALENLLQEEKFETLDDVLGSTKKPKRGRIS